MENLLVLEVSREPLEAHHLSGLHELATTAYHRACYVIPSLAVTPPEEEAKMLDALNGLFQAVRSLGDGADLKQLRSGALLALAATSGGSAALRGGGVGLLHADGTLAEADLVQHLHGHLHSSREGGEDGPNFLRGLLKTARSALWLVPEVLANLHQVLRDWDEDRFIKLLPLLRLALADLTPRETDRVAKSVAAMLGAESLNVATLPDMGSEEMLRAVEINRLVRGAWPRTDWRCSVMPDRPASETDLQRWRLVLGRFAEPRLGSCGNAHRSNRGWTACWIISTAGEYRGRGIRGKGGGKTAAAAGPATATRGWAAMPTACSRSPTGSSRSASFSPTTRPRSSSGMRWIATA